MKSIFQELGTTLEKPFLSNPIFASINERYATNDIMGHIFTVDV